MRSLVVVAVVVEVAGEAGSGGLLQQKMGKQHQLTDQGKDRQKQSKSSQ